MKAEAPNPDALTLLLGFDLAVVVLSAHFDGLYQEIQTAEYP